MKTGREGSFFPVSEFVLLLNGQNSVNDVWDFLRFFSSDEFNLQIDLESTIQKSLKTAVQLVVA